GAATLGGTFAATLAQGFGLTSGDVYTVMSFPSHMGSFASVMGTNLGLSPSLTNTMFTLTALGTQPDLSPTAVNIVTPSAQPGDQVTITYAVKNGGGIPATGSWDDSVYLSTSPFVAPNSVLLGTVHHTGDLAAQATYSETLKAPLPPLLPGAYRVVVVADSRNLVPDSNRSNNTAASTGSLTVMIPLLTLGARVSSHIANGQDVYYHLVLAPNANAT